MVDTLNFIPFLGIILLQEMKGGLKMPTHKSAAKRLRQDKKRHERNVSVKSKLKTLAKKVEEQIQKGDINQAKEALREATSSLDKAVQKGIIHKNKAARKKSILMRKVNAIKPSP
jgi:small subunit ribosomal protein S20